MKILILAFLNVDTSDIPLMVADALEKLGVTVHVMSPIDENTLLERSIERAFQRESRMGLAFFGRRVLKFAKEFSPDYVMVYGSNFYLLPRHHRKLKEKVGCKLILWEGNIQFWKWYQVEALQFYDFCFALDSYTVPLLKGPAGMGNVSHLGVGCDPVVHVQVNLTEIDRERFGADVSVIASGFPNRIKLFENLSEFDLKLWGRFWDQSPKLGPYFMNEPVYGIKKCKVYNASKISINLQNPVSQINGVSCRVFEILACGGFPLTENKKDLSLYFDVGTEIVAFDGVDDLKDKIKYYLEHPDEREEIARRGRERVLREHTYKHRMEEMLRIINEHS